MGRRRGARYRDTAREGDYKIDKQILLGRIRLLFVLFLLPAIRLSAQSIGYLEFVENKGQWDTSVRFNASIGAGNLFMQRNGFTVLMHDTNDMKRVSML